MMPFTDEELTRTDRGHLPTSPSHSASAACRAGINVLGSSW